MQQVMAALKCNNREVLLTPEKMGLFLNLRYKGSELSAGATVGAKAKKARGGWRCPIGQIHFPSIFSFHT